MTTETTTPEAWQLPTGMPRLFEGPAIAIRTAGNSCAIFAPSTGGTSVAGTWSLHQLPDNKIPLVPKTAELETQLSPNAQEFTAETLKITPVTWDALPAPDATNPVHGDFVRDWFGQIDDDDLGGGRDWTDGAEGLGEVVRGQVLAYIDRVEREQAEKARQDKMIDEIGRLIGDATESTVHPAYAFEAARALLTEFDITPKAGA